MKKIILALVGLALIACNRNESSDQNATATEAATGNPAIDNLSAQILRDSANAELYAQRAALYYENDGYDFAIRDLHKAMLLDSVKAEYHHLLADVYLDYFQSRLALKTMERAALLHPERIPTLLKLCEVQYILKQYENSMKTIDRILKIDPQTADAFFMFGMNFKELGDTVRSINSFQSAVELDPDMTDAWINLGQLHAAIKSKMAGRFFDNAIRVDPKNPVALHAKAEYLTSKDDLNGAIALYKEINITDPQYEDGYFNAGLLYMELDSFNQAYQQFDLALKVSPTYIKAYAFRGVAAENLGKFGQAKSDYEQALRMAPDYELAKEGLARVGGKVQ